MQPQIISSYDAGKHNADLNQTISRLTQEGAYKDQSTVIIIPAYGQVPTKAVASWLSMYNPPNQKIVRLFAVGMEVGAAYENCVASILAHPDLSQFKYLLFMEHDNIVPPDGFVQLLKRMEQHPEYSVIGGLYFTKGESGQPQIWGDPNNHPLNFRPQKPDHNGGLVECNGTGQGFTLARLDMFKDPKFERPWFKTSCDTKSGCYTQDLWFAQQARKLGYRFAVDCSVRVGHYDLAGDKVW